MRVQVKSHSHVWLLSTPWTVALQAPLSVGILQARRVEWVTISFSRGPSQFRDRTWVSHIAGWLSTLWATRTAPGKLQPSPIYLFICSLTAK